MTLDDLKTIQDVKNYAISRQRYNLACMLREAEKTVRADINDQFTTQILDRILNEIQNDQQEEKNLL